MSGSIGSGSYLTSLFGAGLLGAGSPGGDSPLSTLYGLGGQTVGSSNPIAALRQATLQETKQVALTAAQPDIKRDIAGFTNALQKARTPEGLLNDPRALKVLLTANGLGDRAASTALAKKALLSDPDKDGSLVNRLTDTRWKQVAKTYSFATKGLTVLADPKVIGTITNGYAEVAWRRTLDRTTPGLSNALDFQNRASAISTVDQVLSDPTFREVLTTTLGVPREIAFQTLGAQENALSSRIDLRKFQDPKFVTQFTRRYLIQAAQNAASAAPAANGTDLTTLAVRSPGLVV